MRTTACSVLALGVAAALGGLSLLAQTPALFLPAIGLCALAVALGATAHTLPLHVSGLTGILLLAAALARWLEMDVTPAIVAMPVAAWASIHWLRAHAR